MTTLTEGQHKGEGVVQEVDADRGDWTRDGFTFASGNGVVADATVVKDNGSGKAVPIVGSVDTAGDSNEAIIGVSYGAVDTTNADVKGTVLARGVVLNVNKVTIPGANDAAVIAALKKLTVIVR